MNSSVMSFFTDVGRKIGVSSGDDREGPFLFQPLSMALQRYNILLTIVSLESTIRTDSSSRFVVLISLIIIIIIIFVLFFNSFVT